MSFYELILWALQPVKENSACSPDALKDHQHCGTGKAWALEILRHQDLKSAGKQGVSMQIPSWIQLSNDLLSKFREKSSS